METVEDIVREMREAESVWHRSEIAELPTQYLKEWADRIEAAYKNLPGMWIIPAENAKLREENAELREENARLKAAQDAADREDELGIEPDEGERPEDSDPEEDEDDLGICARCAFYGTDDCIDQDNFDIVTMLCTGFSERN